MDFFYSNYTHIDANLWSLYECGMNVINSNENTYISCLLYHISTCL
jgi:hypothetical protein